LAFPLLFPRILFETIAGIIIARMVTGSLSTRIQTPWPAMHYSASSEAEHGVIQTTAK